MVCPPSCRKAEENRPLEEDADGGDFGKGPAEDRTGKLGWPLFSLLLATRCALKRYRERQSETRSRDGRALHPLPRAFGKAVPGWRALRASRRTAFGRLGRR